jgi:hypothetical protein
VDADADAEHGTPTAYKDGCRCSECRSSHANYMRSWRRGLAASRTKDTTLQPDGLSADWRRSYGPSTAWKPSGGPES